MSFLYRGFGVSGLETGSTLPGTEGTDYTKNSQALYNYIRDKGFNLARIAFNWERLQLDLNGSLDQTYLGYIQSNVLWAKNAGLSVILDCHNFAKRHVKTDGGFTSNFTTTDNNWSGGTQSGGVLTVDNFGTAVGGTVHNPVNPATSYKFVADAKIYTNGASDTWRALWLEVYRTDANNFLFFTMSNTGGSWQVGKRVNGTDTILASGSNTWNLDQAYTITMDVGQASAGNLIVKNGAATLATVAIPSGFIGGYVGVFANGVNGNIDNVTLDVAGDTSAGTDTYRSVGDGTLTTAHLSDMWTKLVAALPPDPYSNILAWGIMNEPNGLTVATTTSTYNTTATNKLMHQAVVTAIRALGDTRYCCIALDSYSGIQNFVTNYGTNPSVWITDPINKLIWEGHLYFDSDYSGTYSGGWDSNSRLSNLHQNVYPFFEWIKNNNLIGFMGEYGWPSNDDRWTSVGYTLLKYMDDYDIWGAYFFLGEFGAGNATTDITAQPSNSNYNTERKQMSVLKLYTGGQHTAYVSGPVCKFQCIDTMTWTKDSVRGNTDAHGGYTLAQIDGWCSALASMNPTHIAVSTPFNNQSDYPVGQSVDPLGGVGYLKNWIAGVRRYGKNVLHRSTDIRFEGLYGKNIETYSIRSPGSKSSDNSSISASTWLGIARDLVANNPDLFRENDIIAIYPEPTSFQFSFSAQGQTEAMWQSNSILSQFYFDLKIVLDIALVNAGIRGVYTGYSSCTYSELNSGYISTIYYNAANVIAVDHYDRNPYTHSSALKGLYNAKSFLGTSRRMFLQEFGDIYNTGVTRAENILNYLKELYNNRSDYVGINYWCAPVALINTSDSTLTEAGSLFKQFFGGQTVWRIPRSTRSIKRIRS